MSRYFRKPPAPSNLGTGMAALMVTGTASAVCLAAGIAIGHDPDSDLGPGPILFICLSSFFLLIVPIFGIPSLHRWAICWYWLLSLLVLLAYPIAVLVCLADFFGLTSGGARDTYHIYQPIILLALSSPGLWFLLQLVRDPWWQPWRKDL